MKRRNIHLVALAGLAAISLFAQSTNDSNRRRLIEVAQKYKGVPYVYGAESPQAFDCSGFVRYVYREATGVALPRNSKSQYAAGEPIKKESMRPGDVMVFDTVGGAPSHVALFMGNKEMIHAVSDGPKTGIIVSSVDDRYFGPKFIGARVFLGAEPPGLAAGQPAPPPVAQPAAPPASSPPAPPPASPPEQQPSSKPVQPSAPAASQPTPPPAAQTPPVAPPQAQPVAPPQATPAAPAVAPPQALPQAPVPSQPPASTKPSAPATVQPPASAPKPVGPPPKPEPPIAQIGFKLLAGAQVFTDKIPAATGTGIAFSMTNATGKDGRFVVIFYKAEVEFSKSTEIHRELVSLKNGGFFELPPYVFTKPGVYKLIVKDNWNTQLMERVFKVIEAK